MRYRKYGIESITSTYKLIFSKTDDYEVKTIDKGLRGIITYYISASANTLDTIS